MNYPRYQSHKHVSAVKIAEVDPGADGSLTLKLEGGFDDVVFPHHELKNKPKPEAGWYIVMYDDGYVSFSPAKSFEAGYTAVAGSSAADADSEDNSAQAEEEADKGAGPDAEDEDDVDEEVVDAANDHGQAEAAAD